MVVCNRCKQNSNFIVKDAYQICGSCGTTTLIPHLQNRDFSGTKLQKYKIHSQKVAENQQELIYIEENWGIYLEAFQRALRESVRMIKVKLNLDNSFDEKAKYYWFEYLKVFRENKIPLIGFFTTPKSGNNHHNVQNIRNIQDIEINKTEKANHKQKLYETRYKQKKSAQIRIEQDEVEEEYLEEEYPEKGKYDSNFVENILKQKSTHDQQLKVLNENNEINEIFLSFEDLQRVNYEFNRKNSIDTSEQHAFDSINNIQDKNIKQRNSDDMKLQKGNSHYKDDFNKNRIIETKQKISTESQNKLQNLKKNNKKKKFHFERQINYIENLEEIGKNYFMLVLDRSEEYVLRLYNGFRSAYLHMLYLQEKEVNPLKRIKKLKEKSKCFSIPKSFILKEIEKRDVQFLKKYHKMDIFHLIWAWDWAEFISSKSQIQFKLKQDVQLLYDYLETILQTVRKQYQENQTILNELDIAKQQLQKEINKNPQKNTRLIKNKNLQKQIQEDIIEEEYNKINKKQNINIKEQNQNNIKKQKVFSPSNFVMETHSTNKLELNQNTSIQIETNINVQVKQQSQSISRKNSNAQVDKQNNSKQDENIELLKIIKDLENQLQIQQSKRLINLNHHQLLTVQAILQEILKERDLICNDKYRYNNPLFSEQIEDDQVNSKTDKKQSKKDDRILPLEYNLIPTIIYISLYSIGETYSPSDINLWMKNGLFPYNLGIGPYIKIDNAHPYWLYPQSIPSSTFIRSQAKKFVQMTNHTINISKKRIFSDFGLPLEWACMINIICVRLFKDKHDKELVSCDEFDCDIIVSTVFIVVLKMIYGLNDEMFGVLINREILEEIKEHLNENQYSFLNAIVLFFENSRFRPTTNFYQTVPNFKEVSNSIQKYNTEQKEELLLDLSDYKQMTHLSQSNLSIILKSAVDKKLLSQSCSKSKNKKNKDDCEEILYIKQMRSHLSAISQTNTYSSLKKPDAVSQNFSENTKEQQQMLQLEKQQKSEQIEQYDHQNPVFCINKNYVEKNGKGSKKFSQLLQSDLEHISNQVITKGKLLAPPCYDYEIEKHYATNSENLPNELKFIVDQLSIYIGEDSTKILHYLERIEGKILKLVIKNTKSPLQSQSSISLDTFKHSESQKAQIK